MELSKLLSKKVRIDDLQGYSTIQKNSGNKNNKKSILNKNDRRCREVKTQKAYGQGLDSNNTGG